MTKKRDNDKDKDNDKEKYIQRAPSRSDPRLVTFETFDKSDEDT